MKYKSAIRLWWAIYWRSLPLSLAAVAINVYLNCGPVTATVVTLLMNSTGAAVALRHISQSPQHYVHLSKGYELGTYIPLAFALCGIEFVIISAAQIAIVIVLMMPGYLIFKSLGHNRPGDGFLFIAIMLGFSLLVRLICQPLGVLAIKRFDGVDVRGGRLVLRETDSSAFERQPSQIL